MPRTPRRGRTRRGTVVKSRSRDPLQGFTFSPRSSRRDAEVYDMGSDGLTRRRTPPRRRRRRTRVKTPESDPFDFGDEAFSPVNARRQGMYMGAKKKKKSKGKKKKGSKKKGNKRKSMRKTRKYLGGTADVSLLLAGREPTEVYISRIPDDDLLTPEKKRVKDNIAQWIMMGNNMKDMVNVIESFRKTTPAGERRYLQSAIEYMEMILSPSQLAMLRSADMSQECMAGALLFFTIREQSMTYDSSVYPELTNRDAYYSTFVSDEDNPESQWRKKEEILLNAIEQHLELNGNEFRQLVHDLDDMKYEI